MGFFVFYGNFHVSGYVHNRVTPLQIQTKAIDNSKNILALKSARNANEVISVLSRINTSFNVLASKYNNEKSIARTTIERALEAIAFCVDSLIELRCARSVAQEFNDAKRDRCFAMIEAATTNVRALQKRVLSLVDKTCLPHMDGHLTYLGEAVMEVLSKIGKVSQLHVKLPERQMVVFRTSHGAADKNGYASGPITVKVQKIGASYAISLPDSPYVETENTSVADALDVKRFLVASISDFEYLGRPTPPANDILLEQPNIKSVDVHDDRLDINLYKNVKPTDINAILISVLPLLRRALNTGTDVIHKVTESESGDKTISFVVAKRVLHDPRSLSRVTKLLNLTRSEKKKLTDILEPNK